MRYQKVLFVIPFLPGRFGFPAAPYTGTGYVAEYIKQKGIEYDVIDMRLGYTDEDLQKKIEEFKPDIIGFTIFTFKRSKAFKTVEFVKELKLPVVIGGPHASTFRAKIFGECNVDYVIKGEGEETLYELCIGKPLNEIKGLIYKDWTTEPKIIENEDRPWKIKLDEFPWPRYEKFELKKYARNEIHIMTSRGCPAQCIFCPIVLVAGRVWRARSAEDVFEEIKYWYKKGYDTIKVSDDNLTLDKDRVMKLCDFIIKNNIKINIESPNGIRADKADKELLSKMKESGWSLIAFGVESANNDILKTIKKGENIETIEEAIKNAIDLDFDLALFFMVGNPCETPKHIENSMKFAMKYPVRSANFYNVVPFPGTELYDYVDKNNLWRQDKEKYLDEMAHFNDPIFETPEFSVEERKKMLKEVLKIERWIRRRHTKIKLRKKGIIMGFFGGIAADVIYSDFLFERIIELQSRNKYFKKMLIFFAKKLGLGYTL